jgi:hypothetical protein
MDHVETLPVASIHDIESSDTQVSDVESTRITRSIVSFGSMAASIDIDAISISDTESEYIPSPTTTVHSELEGEPEEEEDQQAVDVRVIRIVCASCWADRTEAARNLRFGAPVSLNSGSGSPSAGEMVHGPWCNTEATPVGNHKGFVASVGEVAVNGMKFGVAILFATVALCLLTLAFRGHVAGIAMELKKFICESFVLKLLF